MNLRRIPILFVALALLFGCESHKGRDVPPQLLGKWRTADEKYANLYLEISKTQLIFPTVEGVADNYAIQGVEATAAAGATLYTVHLRRDAHDFEIGFFYDENNGGQIKFRNQLRIVWSKAVK